MRPECINLQILHNQLCTRNYLFTKYRNYLFTNIYNKRLHHKCTLHTTADQGPAQVLFVTDSFPIRVDNCCTRTISFDILDFIADTLVSVADKAVSGFVANSNTAITKIGTISWNILDDNGTVRNIQIPNSYFVPEGTTRLLSPQHWAQQANDDTTCITNANTKHYTGTTAYTPRPFT
jgi:hypothetical protein